MGNLSVTGNQIWIITKELDVVPERVTEGEAPFTLTPGCSLTTMGLLKRDHGMVLCSTRGTFVLIPTAELLACGRYDHDWL